MYIVPLGYVKVASHGTPKKLSTVLAALGLPADLKVGNLQFWPLAANTGIVYVGLSDGAPGSSAVMNVTTGAGVLKQLVPPGANGHADYVDICSGPNTNAIRVADYAVDSAVDNEGFTVFGVVY